MKLKWTCIVCKKDAGGPFKVKNYSNGRSLGPVCNTPSCRKEVEHRLAHRS